MEIDFVRHIEPDFEKGICYGQLNVPLPKDYEFKHDLIISTLSKKYDVIYSSPLSRCKLLSNQITNSVVFDNRLMEVNFGDWEGKKWDNINQTELNYWMENYITSPPPNGESLTDLMLRFSNFISDLKQTPHSKILIVTHAGIIRCAMALFNGIPLNEIMMQKVEFGKIITFTST